MEYKIISSNTSSDLEEKVKYYISRGWTPTGGVSVEDKSDLFGSYSTTYRQSMVK